MSVSPFETAFLRKVEDRCAVVGVIGLGYVGLPLALSLAEAGFTTLGFDVDRAKMDLIQAGRSYILHIPGDRLQKAVAGGRFSATGDFSRAAEADALIICVPTPLNRHREPDLSFVTGTLDSLLPHLKAGQLLSLESTTYPGTTAEVLRPPLEKLGFKIGTDFFLVFSPEREDPGNPDFETRTIPKVLGGETEACARVGLALYRAVIGRMIQVSSTRAAELVKLLENIYRAVNIGLVNELKMLTDRMGLDVFEIINAAATKPFGFTPFYPGPGLGGHCIPIDPFYLTWKARAYGVNTRFIELAGEINRSMPHWVVEKLAQALNDRGRPLKGARVLILGLAYKKDVADMRESPSVEIMELLLARGADLCYSDPHVPVFPSIRRGRYDLASVPLTPESLRAIEAALLLTNHAAFDYRLIADHAPLIVDTRGVFEPAANVVRA